ncbi:Fungalysin/Thermolysin Extracellular metalloproteinase 5, variant 2 [Cadophora gregata]|uniref:Fungalysin/Thermolysin Extracellular metalloproteinase 5, variant 2 n=1 Tax=Cadophora gregata TaxID=51156 RepID=UPI0026DBB458|nr:Fungalysin/Thermolysin Extracellular metalloproteinase 5, variant 2 [Cadophora gregata]KAK0109422.1 Fungalysin/Thermolysin Extracellular metalloproteinase 5, variant 2 [Cadophora gregata]KAK0110950.1 Fungalysin/Thermolysin Extracellular metalloproteinase 5, variant 2 [Cadophora gregata f. sp. sojae]
MRFLSHAGTVALLAANVLGHPSAPSTSRRGLSPRVIDLTKFRITTESTYSNATATAESEIVPLVRRADYVDTATALVASVAPGAEFRVVDDHYVSDSGIAHVNFKQTAHGLDIDNADFNVNVAADGTVFSYGNSFYTGAIPAESPLEKRDQIDAVAALQGVTSTLVLPIQASDAVAVPEEAIEHYVIEGSTGTLSEPKAKLVYFQKADGTLTLTWRVETDIGDNWLLSYLDAVSGSEVLGVVDYGSDASYTVFPWLVIDPSKGSRTVETNPQLAAASEFGFQSDGTTSYTVTRGNNGIAQANWEGDSAYLNDYRPDGGSGANFNFGLDLRNTDPKTYANASVAQLFYTANMYHDLLYVLGFNEAAGNFETNNNGQGGRGNDAVQLNAQDGAGTNNANFFTPADGTPGRMRSKYSSKFGISPTTI